MLAGQHVGRTAKKVASVEVITSFIGLACLKNYPKKEIGELNIPDYIEFLERISQKTETDANRDPTQQFIDAGKEIPCNLYWEDPKIALQWFTDMMKVGNSMGRDFNQKPNAIAVQFCQQRAEGKVGSSDFSMQSGSQDKSIKYGMRRTVRGNTAPPRRLQSSWPSPSGLQRVGMLW